LQNIPPVRQTEYSATGTVGLTENSKRQVRLRGN
jgi:hypothetical protein